jgi:aminopeptidase N
MAHHLEPWLLSQCESPDASTYVYQADAIAKRSLRNTALGLLVDYQSQYHELALQQFHTSTHMTGKQSALQALVHSQSPLAEACLSEFAASWQHEALVMDQWFALQASAPFAATLERVKQLLQHPDFHHSNPNRVRALIGQFANNNPVAFHQPSGEGYALLLTQVQILDQLNPQIAARLLGAMGSWQRFDGVRQQKARQGLAALATQSLSSDVLETVQRLLAATHPNGG